MVKCRDVGYTDCGLYLGHCTNGRTYECQHNVTQLKEKEIPRRYGPTPEKQKELDLRPLIIRPGQEPVFGSEI